MKITIGPIPIFLLLLRLWLSATVFLGLCAGIFFLAFHPFLLLLDQTARGFIGAAYLVLLILYIILGVAFTSFAARLLRRSLESEEWRTKILMVILSGVPFYVPGLLLLALGLSIPLNPAAQSIEMIGAVFTFSLAGALGFALLSCGYVILALFFLRRPTAIAHQ